MEQLSSKRMDGSATLQYDERGNTIAETPYTSPTGDKGHLNACEACSYNLAFEEQINVEGRQVLQKW